MSESVIDDRDAEIAEEEGKRAPTDAWLACNPSGTEREDIIDLLNEVSLRSPLDHNDWDSVRERARKLAVSLKVMPRIQTDEETSRAACRLLQQVSAISTRDLSQHDRDVRTLIEATWQRGTDTRPHGDAVGVPRSASSGCFLPFEKNQAMTEPQTIWCQPVDQPRRQFVVIFDDPDQAIAVFDNEMDARAFWNEARIDWNCHLLGALPQEPGSSAAAEILERLEKIAIGQRQYFDAKQTEYPAIEDFVDDEGVFTLPNDIEPLLNGHHYNGRFSEADWWLGTILSLATDYPSIIDGSGPVAFACKADIDMLAGKPEGHDISLSREPKPQYGMKMPLYADRDGSRTAILDELHELRAALRPFAEALERGGDNPELVDSISLAWALQTSKLLMTDVSVGDLRRAKAAFVPRPTEIEKIIPRPSRPSGELKEAISVIAGELASARRQEAARDTDTAGKILGQLMLLSERAKR